ncbi:MAG: ATP-binding protein [Vampirovibrio sp.]|nr:ATP-binding protein [Vampirovibrio sp.]
MNKQRIINHRPLSQFQHDPNFHYELIWIEPCLEVRETYKTWIGEHAPGFEFVAVANLEEASAFLATLPLTEHVVVLLEPIGIEGGEDALTAFADSLKKFRDSELVFLTEHAPDDYIVLGKKLGVYNVLAKSETSRPDWLEKEFVWTLHPSTQKAISLETLVPNPTHREQMTIANSNDIQKVFQQTLDLVGKLISEEVSFEIGTALMEAFTNAVYHGNVDENGKEIYEKGSFVEALAPNQTVDVCFSMNTECFALSIIDQGGSLTTDGVMYWLERNVTDEGLFDTSGRGLFLMHCLMDRLLIRIVQKKRTELFLFKEYNVPEGKTPLAGLENKPLLISLE